jgi:NADPH-dependent glutamate synthase beta subunit-like oxidoreductase/NAD-dependent dihydropyrimidine dehydrogenase PreA subunit
VIDRPIAIRALKRVLCDAHGAEARVHARWHCAVGVMPPATRPAIAIVGAGPAGLAAAHDLRLAGHAVTVFEAAPEPGGMLVLGIPAFRLPRAVVAAEIAAIVGCGISLRTGCAVGRDISLDALLADFAAVLVAVGCHAGRHLEVPGASLPGVVHAIDYLRETSLQRSTDDARPARVAPSGGALVQGEVTHDARPIADTVHVAPGDTPVVIIGGGSVAFDAARTAWRAAHGADAYPMPAWDGQAAVDAARSARRDRRAVTMIAPESRAELRVPAEELHEALLEGVTLREGMGVVRIVGTCEVTGVEIAPVRSLVDDAGRYAPVLDLARTETIATSRVVLAVGQGADVAFAAGVVGAHRTTWGGLAADADGRTAHPRLWAAGDVASGPRDLIDAIAFGQRAAASIRRALGTPAPVQPPVATAPPMPRATRFWSGYDTIARVPLPVIEPASRDARREVEAPLAADAAAIEGARCLRCDEQLQFAPGRCIACRLCVDVCPQRSLAFAPRSDGMLAFVFDEDTCIRCGLCVARCPVDALAFATRPTGVRLATDDAADGRAGTAPCP